MKRITKILMLTFIFTMFITSTCFAYSDVDITAYNEFVTIQTNGSYSNFLLVGNDLYVLANGTVEGTLSEDGSSVGVKSLHYWSTSISYNDLGVATVTGTNHSNSIRIVTLPINSITYSTTNIYDTDGNQIFPIVQEPDIPDIPAVSLPSSDHSKNYYFMYVNNSGSTGLAVFSSNNEIIFNAVVDNNSAYIDFTFTSPMNYSNYVLRDGDWIILENANYDEAVTKNVNIGYTTILSSSFNVLNEDGTIFFPVTPLLEEIAGAGLTEMWKTIMKAVMVILIIAVSFLALWISLIVLLKVLRIYLT